MSFNRAKRPSEGMLFLTVFALWASSFTVVQATTILSEGPTLAELIDGDLSITVVDKVFSNFAYSATGDMPESTRVRANPIVDEDPMLGTLYGIRFQGGFIDYPGDGASDALISYKVSAGPGMLISDAHLAGNVSGGSGFWEINETFHPPFDPVGVQTKIRSTIGQGVAWTFFDEPVAMMDVQKDILFDAGEDPITASFIDQMFSQVPEPSGLVAFVLGCFIVLRRR